MSGLNRFLSVIKTSTGFKLRFGSGLHIDLPDTADPSVEVLTGTRGEGGALTLSTPVADAVKAAAMPTIVTVSTSRALTAADNGKVLRCSAAVTLEYPEGLGAEFACLAESPASGDVTIDPTGSCTANAGSTSLTRNRADNQAGFAIRALAANVAGVSGA